MAADVDESSAQTMAICHARSKDLFDDLPEDLLAHIFVRLPVKTIFSLSAVNKTANRTVLKFIKESKFIGRQLNYSLSELEDRILLVEKLNFSLFGGDGDFRLLGRFEIPFGTSSRTSSRMVGIIGSCDGLQCLTDDGATMGREIYVCNPVLGKHMKLNTELDWIQDMETVLGFGYYYEVNKEDKIDKHYKAVRLIYDKNKSEPKLIAQIYSFNEKKWSTKVQKLALVSTALARSTAAAFVDGRMYWIRVDSSLQVWLIWFDLKDEWVAEMKLPFTEQYWIYWGVMRWDDKVTVYSIDPSVGRSICVFWVQQRSDGGKISWVEGRTFEWKEDGLLWPVGCTFTGKPLFVFPSRDNRCEIFVFNREDNEFNRFSMGNQKPYTVDPRFVESLVWFY